MTDKDALHQKVVGELAGLTEKSNGGELRVANKMQSQSHEGESEMIQLIKVVGVVAKGCGVRDSRNKSGGSMASRVRMCRNGDCSRGTDFTEPEIVSQGSECW